MCGVRCGVWGVRRRVWRRVGHVVPGGVGGHLVVAVAEEVEFRVEVEVMVGVAMVVMVVVGVRVDMSGCMKRAHECQRGP